MLCYLGILPPKNIAEKIESIRKKYYQKNISIPHITIIPPFTPKGDLSEITESIKKVLMDFKKFNLELDTLEIVTKKDPVLLINLKDEEKLRLLQKKLLLAIKGKVSDIKVKYPLKFHITILKRMEAVKIEKALCDLAPEGLWTKYTPQELILFVILKNEPWQIKEKLEIGANR